MKYLLLLLISVLSVRADQFKLTDVGGDNVLAVSEKYRIIARYSEDKFLLVGPDKSEVNLSKYGYSGGGIYGVNNFGEFVWSTTGDDGKSNLYFVDRNKHQSKIENAFVFSDRQSATNWHLNDKGEFMYVQSEISEDLSKVTYRLMTLKDGVLSGISIPGNLIGEGVVSSYEENKVFFQATFYPIPDNYTTVNRKFFVYTKEAGFKLLSSDLNLNNYTLADSNKNDYLAVLDTQEHKISLVKYNAAKSTLKFAKKFATDIGADSTQLYLNNFNEVIATVYNTKAPFYSTDIVYLRDNKSTKLLCSFKNSSKIKYASLNYENSFRDSRKFVVFTSKVQNAAALPGNESKNWCVDTTVKVIGSCAGYFNENLGQIKNFPKEGMRCSFELTLKDSKGKALRGLSAVITRNNNQAINQSGNVIASALTDANGKAVLKVTFEKKEVFNDSYFLQAPYAQKDYRGMAAYIGNDSGA